MTNYNIMKVKATMVTLYQAYDYKFWKYMSEDTTLTEDVIREFKEFLLWHVLCSRIKFSESFLREMIAYLPWDVISQHQNLSEKFIADYKDLVDWNKISGFQKLSEPFMLRFARQLNWFFITKYQKFSDDFIIASKQWIHWKELPIGRFTKEIILSCYNYIPALKTQEVLLSMSDTEVNDVCNALLVIYKLNEEKVG